MPYETLKETVLGEGKERYEAFEEKEVKVDGFESLAIEVDKEYSELKSKYGKFAQDWW